MYVTSVHQAPQDRHDAASAWVEDVTKFDFKICLRELKNFDGVHEDVRVVRDPHVPVKSSLTMTSWLESRETVK